MTSRSVDIAILTVIPEELGAARQALNINSKPEKSSNGTNYWVGKVRSHRIKRSYCVALGCIGSAGNPDAASATQEIINRYDPQVVLLMGIAAGVRDKIKIGEAVLSERVFSYEPSAQTIGKDGNIKTVPRPDSVRTEHGIEQDVAYYLSLSQAQRQERFRRRVARMKQLTKGFPVPPPGREDEYSKHVADEFLVRGATIASGEKLLRNPAVLHLLREQHGKIEVGEMEAAGLMAACHRARKPWLVVRGISDFGDDFKDDSFHALASLIAAVTLVDFIAHGLGLTDPDELDPDLRKQAMVLQKNANKGGLAPRARKAAVSRYQDLLLGSCDLLDLTGLPADDQHARTQHLLLRNLYIPLRLSAGQGTANSSKEFRTWTKSEDKADFRHATLRHFRNSAEEQTAKEDRKHLGNYIQPGCRVMVLGDPGSGKSTIMRWLAIAYLLRIKKDLDADNLPDIQTLPRHSLLPILIRCRDLTNLHVEGPLDDILRHTLRMAELEAEQVIVLQDLLRNELGEGRAVLLIDGLDEILLPQLRKRFCERLKALALAFPKAPIVVTSRIVGYREMNFRLDSFQHLTLLELLPGDKDKFVHHWCLLTTPNSEAERYESELRASIHSTDEIERLTGNPLLLTTVALVKRQLGRLPSRRAELYFEAIRVLLNWRSQVDDPIDKREALPQLEYLAFEMSNRGHVRAKEFEVLEILTNMRNDYPHRYEIHNRPPAEFIRLIERRTGLIAESGHVPHQGELLPVYEFRHLTFQEYLTGKAIVDGCFPGFKHKQSIADRIAPIVQRAVGLSTDGTLAINLLNSMRERWSESLRICVSICPDEDVDEALRTILQPLPGENFEHVRRRRAILAALCLADEPSVSKSLVQDILSAQILDEEDGDSPDYPSALDQATLEIAETRWARVWRKEFLSRFMREESPIQSGAIYAMARTIKERAADTLAQIVKNLTSSALPDKVGAALDLMYKLFLDQDKSWLMHESENLDILFTALVEMLSSPGPSAIAGAWALMRLPEKAFSSHLGRFPDQLKILIRRMLQANFDDPDSEFLRSILRDSEGLIIAGMKRDLKPIELFRVRMRIGIAASLGIEHRLPELSLTDQEEQFAIALSSYSVGIEMESILDCLAHIFESDEVDTDRLRIQIEKEQDPIRNSLILQGVLVLSEDKDGLLLLSRNLDGIEPIVDPKEEIDQKRVESAARRTNFSCAEIQERYESLASRYPLRLAWMDGRHS